jgi:hypothetical protein
MRDVLVHRMNRWSQWSMQSFRTDSKVMATDACAMEIKYRHLIVLLAIAKLEKRNLYFYKQPGVVSHHPNMYS